MACVRATNSPKSKQLAATNRRLDSQRGYVNRTLERWLSGRKRRFAKANRTILVDPRKHATTRYSMVFSHFSARSENVL